MKSKDKMKPRYCSQCQYCRCIAKSREHRYCMVTGRQIIHDNPGGCERYKFKKG